MTKQLGLPDLRKAAKKVGATIQNDSSKFWRIYSVWSPSGKTWKAEPGMASIVVRWPANDAKYGKSPAIKDAIERISKGFDDENDNDDSERCSQRLLQTLGPT